MHISYNLFQRAAYDGHKQLAQNKRSVYNGEYIISVLSGSHSYRIKSSPILRGKVEISSVMLE